MDCALTLIAGGPPVKQVSGVLGVARSNVSVKLARTADWQDGRRARKRMMLASSTKSVCSLLICRATAIDASGAYCEASGNCDARVQ